MRASAWAIGYNKKTVFPAAFIRQRWQPPPVRQLSACAVRLQEAAAGRQEHLRIGIGQRLSESAQLQSRLSCADGHIAANLFRRVGGETGFGHRRKWQQPLGNNQPRMLSRTGRTTTGTQDGDSCQFWECFQCSRLGSWASKKARACSGGHCSFDICATRKSVSSSIDAYTNFPSE